MPAERTDAVRVRVPAKVNVHLQVGALRADGFHDLATVFQAVDLVDEIRVSPAVVLRVCMRGVGAQLLPSGPDNIAWRAASLLAEHAEVAPDVYIEIDKAIPVAGGMAGGSADAAATLLACATLWGTGTPRSELMMLAARLGSDVAFPLMGGTALGTSRGEVLTPALTTGRFHWVFAVADFGISAGDAYRELDRQRAGQPPRGVSTPNAVLDALRAGEPRALAAVLHNDLEGAALALAPGLRRTLEAGREFGALGGVVSGSGPTVAFLAEGPEPAAELAAALQAAQVCQLAHTAAGPVPGARVVPPVAGSGASWPTS